MQYTKVFVAIVLMALLFSAAFVKAEEEQQKASNEEQQQQEEYHADHEESEPEIDLEKTDLTPLIDFCKRLKTDYVPLVNHKFSDHTESKIMQLAGAVGHQLDQARHEHLKKDHEHFSCEEAKGIVTHSDTKAFMDNYNHFLSSSMPGKSNKQVIELLQKLRKELIDIRLVNEDSILEIDDALEDLQHLEKYHQDIVVHYDHVIKKEAECTKDYLEFINEMNKISTDKLPNWEHIHQGLNSLLGQCKEDEMIGQHLGDL